METYTLYSYIRGILPQIHQTRKLTNQHQHQERELTEVDICCEALDCMPEWFDPRTWYADDEAVSADDPSLCMTLAD